MLRVSNDDKWCAVRNAQNSKKETGVMCEICSNFTIKAAKCV